MTLLKDLPIWILSKNKRPVNNKGIFCTIEEAMIIKPEHWDKAIASGYNISLKLGKIENTDYYLYCLDIDHADFTKPMYQWIKTLCNNSLLTEKSISGSGAHIFIIKKTSEEFETKFIDFMDNEQLELWTRIRHIVSPNPNKFQNIELKEYNTNLFDTLMTLVEEQEKIKADKIQRELDKHQIATTKKRYIKPTVETPITIYKNSDKKLKTILELKPEKGIDQSANDLALTRKICYYYATHDPVIVRQVFENTDWFKLKDDYHIKKFYRPGYLEGLIKKS